MAAHWALLLAAVGLIGFGSFKAATVQPLTLSCTASECVTSDGRRRPRESLRTELHLARTRGAAIAQLSRLVLNGEPLTDFLAGQHRSHELVAKRFAAGEELRDVPVDRLSRVGPLVVAAVGVVVLAIGLVLATDTAPKPLAAPKPKVE
jgi:hypothetical protein